MHDFLHSPWLCAKRPLVFSASHIQHTTGEPSLQAEMPALHGAYLPSLPILQSAVARNSTEIKKSHSLELRTGVTSGHGASHYRQASSQLSPILP
jgi:hypothetical protein